MASMWTKRLINKLYSKPYLIITNTVTGVVSISIGDVLQQALEHVWSQEQTIEALPPKQQKTQESQLNFFEWDSQRTRNMALAGVYFAAFGHFWYSFLDRRFPSAVGKKVLAEVAMGPPLVSSVFFIVGSLKGQSVSVSWEYMKSNFPVICGVEWLVYIPLQWLNFAYVPAQFRYGYVALISIGYDAFLSYLLHRNERDPRQLFKVPESPKPDFSSSLPSSC